MNRAEIFPWVICNINGTHYGISARNVISIGILSNIIPILNVPHFIRGTLNFRDKNIKVVDARLILGMKSVNEETIELEKMLKERKKDHINWVKTLEKSVKEKKKFTLTNSPHECAFGKWYDSFKTNNRVLNYLLRKFDEPHKKIHSIAKEVNEIKDNNNNLEALNLIEDIKNKELKQMINLFDNLITEYKKNNREVLIVLKNTKETIGFVVDEILSVESLVEDDFKFIESTVFNSNTKICIGKRINSGTPVIILDVEQLNQVNS